MARTLIDAWFKDNEGKLALAARPNAPLITGFAAEILALIAEGMLKDFAHIIAFGAFFTWAWLELFQGVNYFRRALGLAVMIMLIFNAVRHGLFS